jgi:hypothetical protein
MVQEDRNVGKDLSAKKPYQQPTLRIYGDIQYLTESSMTMGGTPDTRGFFMDSRTH